MLSEIALIIIWAVFPLFVIVVAFVILRRRNRVIPSERVAAIVYATQFAGAVAVGWSLAAVIAQNLVTHRPGTAVHSVADVASFSPWQSDHTDQPGGDDPALMFAGINHVEIAVAHAEAGTRWLQLLGGLVSALPAIAVGTFVIILCERIIRRTPFAASLIKLSWVGAGVFLVTGFLGQLLSDLASFRLAQLAFSLIRDADPGAELPVPVWPTSLELWPLWGALALAVLAVLLRHGLRLQRETEGLV